MAASSTPYHSHSATGDQELRERLAELAEQCRLQGPDSVTISLYQMTKPDLERQVRRVLCRLGRRDLATCPEEVAGLALDVADLLAHHLAAWDSSKALPWVWAKRAIVDLVGRRVGFAWEEFTQYLETAILHPCRTTRPPSVPHAPDKTSPDDLYELVKRLGVDCTELFETWLRAAKLCAKTPHHAAVHVEYQIQKALGDPSPAATVARYWGLRPDGVRQIDRRMRDRLADLASQPGDGLRILRRLQFLGFDDDDPDPHCVLAA